MTDLLAEERMAEALTEYPPQVRSLMLEVLTIRDDAERARRGHGESTEGNYPLEGSMSCTPGREALALPQSANEWHECINDGLGFSLDLLERLEGFNPAARSRGLSEEYCAGQLECHVGLGGLRLGEADDDQWRLSYRRAIEGEHLDDFALGRLVEDRLGLGKAARDGCWHSVFVHIVEASENTQHRVSSTARLRRLDDCPHGGWETTDAALHPPPIVVRIRDWETQDSIISGRQRVSVGERDGIDRVVKGAPDAVREVPNQRPPSPVWVGSAVHEIDRYLRLICAQLSDNTCAIRFLEGLDISPQFIQVFTCPVHPGLNELLEDLAVRFHVAGPHSRCSGVG